MTAARIHQYGPPGVIYSRRSTCPSPQTPKYARTPPVARQVICGECPGNDPLT